MSGNPNSSNPSQQKPYVIHARDGRALDMHGNLVERGSPDAHIPVEKYVYRPPKTD
jgi:hypothetical protein